MAPHKESDFSENPLDNYGNQNYMTASPRRHEGRSRDRHATWCGLRWTLAASGASASDETRRRTAKSCGPGAATLASIRPACAGTATVTKKAAHRGEHEVSRQTIARGKPGCLG